MFEPSLRVLRGETELGCWELAVGAPDPALSGAVLGYSGLASQLRLGQERHLPSGETAIVIHLGEPDTVVGSDGSCLRGRALVMGVQNRPFRTLGGSAKELVVVRLAPAATRRLLRVPMDRLANRWVDLQDLDASLARDLTHRLSPSSGWLSCFSALDQIIGERLAPLARPTPAAWGWDQVRRRGGQVSISTLARASGGSHRHFIAGFKAEIGVTPKTAARLERFNRVLRRMRKLRRPPGAGDAAELGYADQSHMLAEFRNFATASPSQVAKISVGLTLKD